MKCKRENDQFLMKAFRSAGYKKNELIKLNRCCLFLQVETLSDIADGKGDQMCTSSCNGERNNFSYSDHDWPIQSKPDAKHWTLWRQALRRSFPRINHQRLGILVNPLGSWIDNAEDKWQWFYSAENSKLCFRTHTNPSWKMHKRVINNGFVRKRTPFKFEGYVDTIPGDAQ